ncbi:MAG: MBL fold metallo-hydrolase [Desulfobacteraceae bacterium]|jgi:glyoxylase-like metal-dependent hydrolase (beta-lactamase superfamily II)
MNIIKTDRFDSVDMIQLGYSPIGSPFMSVFIYRVGGLLIDTAQHHMAKAIGGLFAEKSLSGIILTHHHEDHSGNAAMISRRHAIPVMAHPLAAEKLRGGFPIRPYQHMVWGKAPPVEISLLPDTVETDRYAFTPIHTPGHSKDHTVFLEKKHGWLFSGDLYLGERIKFFRSDEHFCNQIDSLKKVLALDFDVLFCAHNPCLKKGKQKIRNKLQFLEDLYGNIQKLAEQGHSEKAVIKALDPKNDRVIKWFTTGNASFANMVRSALASIHNR